MRRRAFLTGSAWAAAGIYTGLLDRSAARALAGVREPDVILQLRAAPSTAAILPGRPTSVWSYSARLKRGPASALAAGPGPYLGPTIRLRRGQRVRIDFRNGLPEDSIVHWHGLHVPAAMDGHPRFAVHPGATYRYEFDVVDRAGTYWYHPHPHGRTGPQVYAGLAGLLIIEDAEETALGLPSGSRDVALVIQDRHFGGDNALVYRPSVGGMGVQGFLGSQILVNGAPHPTLTVAAAPHRLRLLNGSNSRIYKLAWSDGSRLTVIGNDGGLLRQPVQRDFVTLAPGERVELWADFGEWGTGSERELRTVEFDAGMGTFGHGGDGVMPMGRRADLLTVRVGPPDGSADVLPATLSAIVPYRLADAVNANAPRRFVLGSQFGRFTINGRTFEMDSVAADERVRQGTLEAWDLVNDGGGRGMGMMAMRMPHPVHVHGHAFQVIDRDVSGGLGAAWNTVSAGYVDEGWKDTLLLMPGERARILKRFDDYAGMYVVHCHNLEHEDAGMMRNFLVQA